MNKKVMSFILTIMLSLSVISLVGCVEGIPGYGIDTVILENGLKITNGVVVSYDGEGKENVDLVIPEKVDGDMVVTEIGKKAFNGATSIKTISIPKTIKKVGDMAFRGCTNLEAVNITSLASWCSLTFNSNSTPFANATCKKMYVNGELLTNLILPEGIKTVGAYTFFRCTSITRIEVPNNVTLIYPNAFGFLSHNLTEFKFNNPNNWYALSSETEGMATGYHMYNIHLSTNEGEKNAIAMLQNGASSYWKRFEV